MMFNFSYYSSQIDFEQGKMPVLVIENKQLYRDVLFSFIDAEEEKYFTFSKNFEPLEFNKHGYFISNPIELDFQNKKLLSKLNAYLTIVANNEFCSEFSESQRAIYNLADKLVQFSSFDLTYDERIDVDSIIKLLSLKINYSDQSLELSFISYVLLLSTYLKVSVFVVANLFIYFSAEEVEKICKTLLLNHINLLIIEQSLPICNTEVLSFHILDNDLCQIDKEMLK